MKRILQIFIFISLIIAAIISFANQTSLFLPCFPFIYSLFPFRISVSLFFSFKIFTSNYKQPPNQKPLNNIAYRTMNKLERR